MFVTTDESASFDIWDFGDATVETRQVWFGGVPDSVFGFGFFRN